MTDSATARAHLLRLASVGIGHRRAAKLAGVSVSTVRRLRRQQGYPGHISQDIADRILAVTKPSLAHGTKVNGYRTRYLLDCLRREDMTIADFLRRGLRSAYRVVHADRVTVRTALRVSTLYQHLTAEGSDLPV